jgi:hypothetical protein
MDESDSKRCRMPERTLGRWKDLTTVTKGFPPLERDFITVSFSRRQTISDDGEKRFPTSGRFLACPKPPFRTYIILTPPILNWGGLSALPHH